MVGRISIHLMLLFISARIHFYLPSTRFQYISCYCLSGHVLTGTDVELYFNTSHVTVYPSPLASMAVCKFISIHLMLLFIFPCPNLQQRRTAISIHLMLLFIVPGRICNLSNQYNFNTSHVTVYPICALRFRNVI